MPTEPFSAPSPIEVELKPDIARATPLLKASPAPTVTGLVSAAAKNPATPVGPVKTTPARKAKARDPVYVDNGGSSSEDEEEETEDEFVGEDDKEGAEEGEEEEEEEDGEEDDQSDDDYEEDARVSALPSPPPSSSGTPTKKRSRPNQSGKTSAKVRKTNTKPPAVPTKSGTFSAAEDWALIANRRPLQVGAEWNTVAASLGRTAQACKSRFQTVNKRLEEAVLKGKI